MSFTIKNLREIADQAIEEGMTEDTDVIFAHGSPAKGGQIFLAVATGETTRVTPDGDVKDLFIALETPEQVFGVAPTMEAEPASEDTLVN